MIDEFYSQMIDGIAEGRNLPEQSVRDFVDHFSFSPSKAVEANLLDGLMYYDQVLSTLKRADESKPKLVEWDKYINYDQDGFDFDEGPKIAVIYVSGEIQSGRSGRNGTFGGTSVGSKTIVKAARKIRDNHHIKGVVLRISSPGGSALAADVMWRELSLLAEKKPMVVSMSDLAASGGYWIATASDTIVAEPGTITGSIGVLMGKFNMKELMNKIGVNVEVVSRGRYAQILSPLHAFSERPG
jgi:protease-4